MGYDNFQLEPCQHTSNAALAWSHPSACDEQGTPRSSPDVTAGDILAWEGGLHRPSATLPSGQAEVVQRGGVFGKDVGLRAKRRCRLRGCSRHVSCRDLSCCCMVRGEGEAHFVCTGGFKWSLLNDYRRLLVGSIYFNFSRWVAVSVESSLQALSWQRSEGVGCFAFHPQLPFYHACLLKTQPVFSRGNVNISKQGRVQLTRAKSHFIGSVKK